MITPNMKISHIDIPALIKMYGIGKIYLPSGKYFMQVIRLPSFEFGPRTLLARHDFDSYSYTLSLPFKVPIIN